MRVAHVITGLSAGGAERQLLLLAAHTSAAVTVLSLTADGLIGDRLRALPRPAHVEVVGMRNNRDALGFLRLVRLLRHGDYDAVHLHLFRALVHGSAAARLAGVRTVVYSEHSLNRELVEGRPVTAGVRALYRGCTRLVSVVVAVSEPVRCRLREIGVRAPVVVLPNAVEDAGLDQDDSTRRIVRDELGIAADATVVLVVGRLFHAKKPAVALEAVVPLLRVGQHLLFVGAGPDETALRSRAAELAGAHGHAPSVTFLGEVPDVAAVLAAGDLLVSASPEETFGLAVLEARLAGLPVVYVDCPALDGVTDPGAHRSRPGTAALQAALGPLLGDGPPARVPAPAALSQRYNASALTRQLDALYADPAGFAKTKVAFHE